MGGAPLAAIRLGAKDDEGAQKIIGNCVTMLSIVGVDVYKRQGQGRETQGTLGGGDVPSGGKPARNRDSTHTVYAAYGAEDV